MKEILDPIRIDFNRLSLHTLREIYSSTNGICTGYDTEQGRQNLINRFNRDKELNREIRLPSDTNRLEFEMTYDIVHHRPSMKCSVVIAECDCGLHYVVIDFKLNGAPQGDTYAVLKSDVIYCPRQLEIETKYPALADSTLSHIAGLIAMDWEKVSVSARPYLDAMLTLDSEDMYYGNESGRSIIAYFLANARGWRGAVARMIKEELNRRIK